RTPVRLVVGRREVAHVLAVVAFRVAAAGGRRERARAALRAALRALGQRASGDERQTDRQDRDDRDDRNGAGGDSGHVRSPIRQSLLDRRLPFARNVALRPYGPPHFRRLTVASRLHSNRGTPNAWEAG